MKLKSITDWGTQGMEIWTFLSLSLQEGSLVHLFDDGKVQWIMHVRYIIHPFSCIPPFSSCCFHLGIRVWDVVSELVCLCTIPSPSNPFALDMRYLKSLPLTERFLVSGALLNFLESYAVHGNRDELHYNKGECCEIISNVGCKCILLYWRNSEQIGIFKHLSRLV